VSQAESHLKEARKVDPDDPAIDQALAMVRGGMSAGGSNEAAVPVSAEAAEPIAEERIFAGLEGAQEGLLLLDAAGQVLGGALKSADGQDATQAVAAYLAGVSQEASRTAKLLQLGGWVGLSAEGPQGNIHLTPPTNDALLLVVRDRSVPMGRLAVIAQRAALIARRWLERQA
jgi:predicted regulator of Ras-like GTPase activity (Roadblock/LC7/MglB family)